jgi:CheY-like chemotaxis protein
MITPEITTGRSPSSSEAAQIILTAPPMQKKRILMVDDEAAFTNMVRRALEATGRFEVQAENFALSALATAKKFRPDVILLDVIMPMTDGGTVATQFKADPHLCGTPVIFLTAAVSRSESSKGSRNQGGELFLSKPVKLETLVRHIDDLLQTPGAEHANPAGQRAAAQRAAD